MRTATQILCTGPEPYTGRDGDEHPEWTVSTAGDDREPVSRIYRVRKSLDLARRLAVRTAVDRRLDLNDESNPACCTGRSPCLPASP
jgi:hypothetical protein